jgi:hypothetical protein
MRYASLILILIFLAREIAKNPYYLAQNFREKMQILSTYGMYFQF